MIKLNCQKNEFLLNRLIDGELSSDDSRDVSEHIKNCAVCRQQAVQMQQLSDHLSLLTFPEPNRDFFQSTLSVYRARIIKTTLLEWWCGLGIGLRAATCCIVILGFALGIYLGNIHDQYQQTHIYNPEDVYIAAFEPGEGALP
ncbi:MAG: zf-HC2 domain-containing protein [Desulfobacula sp.]|nr:zf-HC2 domain-containing protein [Desulfobacula sp.]